MTSETWIPGPFSRCPLLLVALIAVGASGCLSSDDAIFTPERSRSMRDVGSVHLSVLSVAPWSEYEAMLQPNFNLDADTAYERVTSDSRWSDQSRGRILQGGSEPLIVDRTADGAQAKANRVPEREVPLRPYGSDGSDYQPDLGSNGGPTGTDAMLKYTAAASLFQEVKLLNRYIGDAAIPNGYRPYMVRLQISLMPSRRHAPYDAYTTVSFFIPGDRGVPLDTSTAATLSTSDQILAHPFGNAPKILPLLVTDNLEASVQSRSLERVQGLALSFLEFSKHQLTDVTAQLTGGLIEMALKDEILGRDLNSLLTVARLSENTMRIRLGARQEATANYSMVPRNHNITLLLMVPEGAPPLMEVVSKTVLVDTENGRVLMGLSGDQIATCFKDVQDQWNLEDLPTPVLERLLMFTQQNDQAAFSALLRASLASEHPLLTMERALWIELASSLIGTQYSSHMFELPGQGENVEASAAIFTTQTVVAEDDGRSTRITLREARFPEHQQILGVLSLIASNSEYEEMPDSEDQQVPAAPARAIMLPASSVSMDVSRRELNLSFPSLQNWGLLEDGFETAPALVLELSWSGETQSFNVLHRSVAPVDF